MRVKHGASKASRNSQLLTQPAHGSKRVWLIAFALVVTTAAVYSPVLWHPFVNYDDESYVVENHHIHAGLNSAMLRWALTSMDESNWHPLTWLSHALDCQVYGLNSAGHHATSMILHGLNAVLLFWLLVRATGSQWRSLAVAVLFALHPLNVESVAWVAERKNVLSMFFLLLTLASYGWYARKPGALRYLWVAILFAAGLAAKPMIVTLPCALLLLDYWPLGRVQIGAARPQASSFVRTSWHKLVLEKLPLLGLSAASSVITLHAQKMSMATTEALPLSQRLSNAIYSYVMYLWKAVWPTHLAVFYPHVGDRLAGWRVVLCLMVLISITWFAWNERRSRAYLLVGWLWFLGNMVPVIGLVQVGDQGMADRYVYLPLIGVFVAVVWGAAGIFDTHGKNWLRDRKLAEPAFLGATAAVFCVLGFLTVRQIATWRSSNDLWAHALQVTDDNYLAEDYMGSALLEQAYETNGQRYSDEATVHFRNAARINPHDAISHLNLGADLHEHGKLREAIEQYEEMLQYTRDEHLMAKAYIALGAAYAQLHDFAEAERFYRLAGQLEPRNQVLFMRMGRLGMEEKIVQLSEAAAAHPTALNYMVLGQLQESAGHVAEARESYRQALKLNPKLEDARTSLSGVTQ
jgi:protein O-mannosyl-transferase